MKVLATLGDFADEGVGRIVEVDLAGGRAREVLTWLPPPSLRVKGKGFTGLAWLGEPGQAPLAVAAHSCICRVDIARWEVTGVLHDPGMNDLHHVAFDGGRLLVANTGADRVDAFGLDGHYLGGWDFAPAWVSSARYGGANPSRAAWQAALRPGWVVAARPLDEEPMDAGYYANTAREEPFHARKMRDFVHPNHVAVVDGRVIVTRFQDLAVQDVSDWSHVIPQTPGHPHDGVAEGDRFWLTCTRGVVVAYAIERGRVTARELERMDVFERSGRSGWCRGLAVTSDLIVVGLTAIERMPRYRWCDRPFETTETSILAFERRTGELVSRVDLGAFGTRPKVFDIEVLP